MIKKIIIFISVIMVAVLFVQIYFVFKEKNQLENKFQNLSAKAENVKNENEKIKSEIGYFSFPQNLEKEFRKRFNYKKIGEKLMIIVP